MYWSESCSRLTASTQWQEAWPVTRAQQLRLLRGTRCQGNTSYATGRPTPTGGYRQAGRQAHTPWGMTCLGNALQVHTKQLTLHCYYSRFLRARIPGMTASSLRQAHAKHSCIWFDSSQEYCQWPLMYVLVLSGGCASMQGVLWRADQAGCEWCSTNMLPVTVRPGWLAHVIVFKNGACWHCL